MRVVRKGWMGAVLALAGAALSVVFASSASAHSCAQPVHVVHDRDTQVNVGVTVGDVPVNDVRIEFSKSVLVKQLVQQRGWAAEQLDEHTVRFSGGSLDPNVCATFPVKIRGTATGSFGVRAFETQADGAVTEHPADGDIFAMPDGSNITVDHTGPPNPAFEQVVYVDDASDSGTPARDRVGHVQVGVARGSGVLRVWSPQRTESAQVVAEVNVR